MSREAFENYMALYWKLNGRWPDSEQVWQAATAEQAEQLTIAMQRIAELEKDADILQTNLDAALMQVKQFKELLSEIECTVYLIAGYESSVTHRDICKQYKALKGAVE